MRDKTYHIYLDSHERKLLIHSLVELKNVYFRGTDHPSRSI